MYVLSCLMREREDRAGIVLAADDRPHLCSLCLNERCDANTKED
jgi:hypothetical protein